VPELPWKGRRQDQALQAIKDAIELPLLHSELFQKFQHATPKGFLLYGPPGCGKTLIGKATAYNLTKSSGKRRATRWKRIFHALKGPEILNMWVGESERIVREIFSTARGKTPGRFPAFSLYRREAERSSARAVPLRYFGTSLHPCAMFARGDGWPRSLHDVVIILPQSPDLIDPAGWSSSRPDRPEDQG